LEIANQSAKKMLGKCLYVQSFLTLPAAASFGFGPDLCFSGLTASAGIAQDLPSRSAPGILPSNAYWIHPAHRDPPAPCCLLYRAIAFHNNTSYHGFPTPGDNIISCL
ncbi:MAG: hypothetical protein IKG87_01305, partial [Clostridia bacterium]|nr:hypothetical protein [Clostridia bacterium]